jgi:long-chain acyl-CoA synthetase
METPIATDSLVLGKLLARHARYRPAHTAVVVGHADDALRLSYAEFDAHVNRWANALAARGLQRGDRIATLLPNCLELLTTYWACAKLGAAAVPLSPLLLAPGVASLLNDAKPRVVIGSRASAGLLEQARASFAWQPQPTLVLVDGDGSGFESYRSMVASASDASPATRVAASDVLTVMYTSGTTGLPKGIPHTHFIRAMYAGLMASSWRMTPESVVLHTGALVFNGALVTMLPAFYCGATFVAHRQFDPEVAIAAIAEEGVTHTMLVPSQIVAILNSPAFDAAKLASLEMILSLGAPLHREHKDALNRELPGRFYELYGLTEGFITVLDRADAVRKAGSVGVPPPFYELRIVDDRGVECAAGEVGEIVGRGPITMAGYLDRPDLTAQALRDGWLFTGDLGYIDEEGFLYLVDRKKDMIDSGGVKVYPKDIEEIAVQHPAVREVAVFGVPHDKWGETPVAAVVLRHEHAASAEELRDWINARVAARYQRVDRVVVMPDFPRSAAGKTLKRELREPYWEGRTRKI